MAVAHRGADGRGKREDGSNKKKRDDRREKKKEECSTVPRFAGL
jgi:hypothetical protein